MMGNAESIEKICLGEKAMTELRDFILDENAEFGGDESLYYVIFDGDVVAATVYRSITDYDNENVHPDEEPVWFSIRWICKRDHELELRVSPWLKPDACLGLIQEHISPSGALAIEDPENKSQRFLNKHLWVDGFVINRKLEHRFPVCPTNLVDELRLSMKREINLQQLTKQTILSHCDEIDKLHVHLPRIVIDFLKE